MRPVRLDLILSVLLAGFAPLSAAERVLDAELHPLRGGAQREWSDFPEHAEGARLEITFQARPNDVEHSLRLRQQDVKQTWRVSLNEKELGKLVLDENDMVVYFAIPPGGMNDGDNRLLIAAAGPAPDDIWVGEVALDPRPLDVVLAEATLELHISDATQTGKPVPTPCRITVVNADGSLVTTAAASNESLAVRPGVIYTANGKAKFDLPAGQYTVYAGRGFEYDIDSMDVSLAAGDAVRKDLEIHREVPTESYVSCDTHIHTLTYSGHGDATIDERVITIAGEGIELPIATDHNRQIDLDAAARRMGVRPYFTPVVGNEVTTAVGHFNIFPVAANGTVPEFDIKEGNAILDSIATRTRARAIVLNHPRDSHNGFRPFGPEWHNAASGENRAKWLLRARAVEVVNSGAQQSDWMQTYRDWFGLLNRGVHMTPVGASDSHDVSRFIVGQARTYIRCPDDRPGEIDVVTAIESFLAGRVLVSCGLLVEITVNDTFGPGDIVPAGGAARVRLRVLGPSWATAEQVTLYANGIVIREEEIHGEARGGVKWSGEWILPRMNHDVHLVAIATGPGIEALYWPIAKPYQPTSLVVGRRVIGSTAAVWLDVDGDGVRTSALVYAEQLLAKYSNRPRDVVSALASYDEAVAVQAAALLTASGADLNDGGFRIAVKQAGPHVDRGFRAYIDAWREREVARSR
jgi:hypothetical protein